MAKNSRQLMKQDKVDPHEEPSVDWGWHGHFPRLSKVAAIVTAIIIVLMLNTARYTDTEVVWSVGIAVGLVAAVVLGTLAKRNSWRR